MGYWIAVVDDEALSLTNARNLLTANDMKASCLRSGHDLIKFLEKNEPDLILLDILMPEMDGFETYRAIRKYEEDNGKPQTPVIFLTGENNSEIERRGLKAGASDFIRKPFDKDILIKRINNTIEKNKTIESLTEEATFDKLTGFLNKASGTDKVSGMCKNTSGALMILDLDNFKLVNDLYGHDMGDRVLVAFSDVVRHNVRAEDIVCRIGGDEFMAFFTGLTQKEAVAALTGRLNEQLMAEADILMGADHGIPLGISVGCAFAPEHATDYQILFQYADSALYNVKQNGKHGYDVFDPVSLKADKDYDLERNMARVIQIVSERGEGTGALLLGQDAFSSNYRFIIRFLNRYGGSACRVLFRINAEENSVIFSEIAAEFGNVLKNSLRKSDLIFRCNPDQFFVVLPLLTEEDVPELIGRVLEEWENTGLHERVKIEYVMSGVSFEEQQFES